MPDQTDDGSILDDACLLRRIHPTQVVEDKNTGQFRPSSAAFKDPELSVDVEPMLLAAGLTSAFSLAGYEGYSLVCLLAEVPRQHQQAVVHKPIPGINDAHAEIIGKKTPGIANRLRDASDWVHLAPKP